MRRRSLWIVPHDERTASVGGGWPCGCAVVLLWVSLLALFPANAHALDTRAIDLRSLTSPDRLVLAFSNEAALDSLAGVAPGKARVVYLSLDELPARWDALDAVDLIALCNLSLAPLRPEQLQALQQWLAHGVHLL